MGSELAGKVAIVTGGASGIGRASVDLFHQEGARVVIADTNRDAGEQLAEELGQNVYFQAVDVTQASDIQQVINFAVNTLGGLDIMFNNAGISSRLFTHFLDDDLEDFQQVLNVNLLGVMLGTQRAARHMANHGGGSIINTASIGGSVAGLGVISYRAAKAAVLHFSRCAAIDLAQYGIRVNTVNPGHIRTPMSSWAAADSDRTAFAQLQRDLDDINLSDQPLKQHGKPEDVAQAALYLASDRSRQVTGIVIPVDGGTTAGDSVNHVQQILDAQQNAFGN